MTLPMTVVIWLKCFDLSKVEFGRTHPCAFKKDKFPARAAYSVCFVGCLEVGEDGRWTSNGICYTTMGHSSLNFPEKEPSDPGLTAEEKPLSIAYWSVNKIRG